MVWGIVLAVLAVFGVAYWRLPRRTRRFFNTVATIRQLVWSVFLLAFAFVAISAGTVGFALVGGAILGYAGLYILYEEPLEPLFEVLGL